VRIRLRAQGKDFAPETHIYVSAPPFLPPFSPKSISDLSLRRISPLACLTMSSRESKRKAPLPQKSKAKAGLQAAVAAAAAGAATKTAAARAGVAASRLPHGSDSAVAPNLAGFRNGMAAAFVGHGSNSPPTPNPSAGTIHPQSLSDGFDSSMIHCRQGYMVGFGAVGSSHGRCGSISPSSPFGHQSSWDPAW
jgi:hypothetical protein